MDERCDLAQAQVTTTTVVAVDQNCLYLFKYCLCVWQGREETEVLKCGPELLEPKWIW